MPRTNAVPALKTCVVCSNLWVPKNRYQAARNQTCGPTCRSKLVSMRATGRPSRNNRRVTISCAVCGTPRTMPQAWLRKVKTPTCSRKCNGSLRGREWATHGHKGSAARKSIGKRFGPANHAWKGGITFKRPKGNYRGVRYVRAPDWAHPMAMKNGYIAEHRLIMAQMCGFLLTRQECVNHKDRNPSNNHPSNLELYPTNGDHKRGEVGRFVEGVANRVSPRVLAPP